MTQPNPTDDLEAVARLLWMRFAPSHEVEWPSYDASEYRLVAKDILDLRPAGVGEAVAYMLEWSVDGESRRRVQTHLRIEPWLEQYAPTITPLYTHHATPAHPDAAMMDRVRDMAEFLEMEGEKGAFLADSVAREHAADLRALLSDLKAEAGR